jgi:Asp-tRNA(Asn)/Glu-tRNA(Gln) amidotransferase A subunit family amidase
VAGVPMRNGTVLLDGYVPDEDATVVERVLDAGGTILGKAVCESLCFSGGSHTADCPPVRNPYDPARSAGGSSSGSAALVASGAVDMAVGGGQGGSVRIPSCRSGIYGLKPTWGWCPTPARSRSSRPWTTSAPWLAAPATWRCCCRCWPVPNTAPFDVTGHPAMNVPCAMSAGLPVGMMPVGRHGDEATILRAAEAFEREVFRAPPPPPS